MLTLAGLGDTGFTPHGMRHFFTCQHVERHCDVKWLQQQLGHKSIKVTLDTYAKHVKLSDHRRRPRSALLGNTAGNRGVS
jgi:integrase